MPRTGDFELARFVDGDLFLLGVDHEDGVGQPRHAADPFEVLLQLAALFFVPRDFLLRQRFVAAVGGIVSRSRSRPRLRWMVEKLVRRPPSQRSFT
jgi:hypothetical protein